MLHAGPGTYRIGPKMREKEGEEREE